jgi:hypothetical protein
MGIWGLQDLRKGLTSSSVVPLEETYNYAGRRSVVGFFHFVTFSVVSTT